MATAPRRPSPALEGRETFRDGLGVRCLVTDAESGDLLERLYLVPELARQAVAVDERTSRLSNFRHARFARLRVVDTNPDPDCPLVWVNAEPVEGVRLFDVLRAADEGRVVIDVNTALQIAREILPALATLHDSRSVTHGALGPERLVLTRAARLTVVDHGLGTALANLQYPRTRLWREFRIVVPPAAGVPVLDARADVAGVAMTVLAALLGRPITLHEYPDHLRELLDRARERPVTGRDRALSAALRSWLERALPIESRRPLTTALEAQVALEDAIKKERAYSPGAAALKHFVERLGPLMDSLSGGGPGVVTAPRETPAETEGSSAPAPRRTRAATSRSRRRTVEEEEADEIAFLEQELARLASEAPTTPATVHAEGQAPGEAAAPVAEVPAAAPIAEPDERAPLDVDAALAQAVLASADEGPEAAANVAEDAEAMALARLLDDLAEGVAPSGEEGHRRPEALTDDVQTPPASVTEVLAEIPLRLGDAPVVEFSEFAPEEGEAVEVDLPDSFDFDHLPADAATLAALQADAWALTAPSPTLPEPPAEAVEPLVEAVGPPVGVLQLVLPSLGVHQAPEAPLQLHTPVEDVEAPERVLELVASAAGTVEATEQVLELVASPVGLEQALDEPLSLVEPSPEFPEPPEDVWQLVPPADALGLVEDDEAGGDVPTPRDPFTLWLDFEVMHASRLIASVSSVPAVASLQARRNGKHSWIARAVAGTRDSVLTRSILAIVMPGRQEGKAIARPRRTTAALPAAAVVPVDTSAPANRWTAWCFDTYDESSPAEPAEAAPEPVAKKDVAAWRNDRRSRVEAIVARARRSLVARGLPTPGSPEPSVEPRRVSPRPRPVRPELPASAAAPAAPLARPLPATRLACLARAGASVFRLVSADTAPAVLGATTQQLPAETGQREAMLVPAAATARPAGVVLRLVPAVADLQTLWEARGGAVVPALVAHTSTADAALVPLPASSVEVVPASGCPEPGRIEVESVPEVAPISSELRAERSSRLRTHNSELLGILSSPVNPGLVAAGEPAAVAAQAEVPASADAEPFFLRLVEIEESDPAPADSPPHVPAAAGPVQSWTCGGSEAAVPLPLASSHDLPAVPELALVSDHHEDPVAAVVPPDDLSVDAAGVTHAEAVAEPAADEVAVVPEPPLDESARDAEATPQLAPVPEGSSRTAVAAETDEDLAYLQGLIDAEREREASEAAEAAALAALLNELRAVEDAEDTGAAGSTAVGAEAPDPVPAAVEPAPDPAPELVPLSTAEEPVAPPVAAQASPPPVASPKVLHQDPSAAEEIPLRLVSADRRRRPRRRRKGVASGAVFAHQPAAEAPTVAPQPEVPAVAASVLAPSSPFEVSLPTYAPWLAGEPLPPGAAEAGAPRPGTAEVPALPEGEPPSVYAAPLAPLPVAPARPVTAATDVVVAPTVAIAAAAVDTPAIRLAPPFEPPREAAAAPGRARVVAGPEGPLDVLPAASPVPAPVEMRSRLPLIAAIAALLLAAAAGAYWLLGPRGEGSLVVQASAQGVEVVVDGRSRGIAPVSLGLPAGRHTVELRGHGATRTLSVEVKAGEQTIEKVNWAAGRSTGSLKVTSTPTGARVLIAGELRGLTPVVVDDLPAGTHVVTVQGDSGLVRRNAQVAAGEVSEIDVSIFSGWLQVFAPFKVEVREDGQRLGSSEEGKLLLSPGTHQIELVNTGLGVAQRHRVEVTPGGTSTLSITAPDGAIEVDAPAGTQVYVDNELTGTTPLARPLRVKVGTRDVVLSHPETSRVRKHVVRVTASGVTRVGL